MKPHSAVLIALFSISCIVQAQPSIASGGIVSAAAFGDFSSVAPGSWIEIYGSNLATDTRSWANSDFNGVDAPTSLDGTSVTINGQSAFVDYISPGQVNAQVPSNVGPGAAIVIVNAPSGQSAPQAITVNATQPGILAPSSFDINGTQYATALFSDGSTYVLPPGAIPGVTSRRAQSGDTITFYGVGFGSVIPGIPAGQIEEQDNTLAAQLQVTIGGVQAVVNYDGLAPNAVGLYQFNVVVPNVAGSDTTPVTFTLGGVPGTQTLYLAVSGSGSTGGIQSFTITPNSVTGSGTAQGLIVLSQPAPAGGLAIGLTISAAYVTVPDDVTVPAGQTSTTITITTIAVASTQTVTITAFYGEYSAQTTLTITPASGTLPPFSIINIENIVYTGNENGTSLFQCCAIAMGTVPGTYGGGNFEGLMTGSITSFTVGFTVATLSGNTITLTGIQPGNIFGPASYMMEGYTDLTQYPITSGSFTITLTLQGPPVMSGGIMQGTATGTYNLVSSIGTLSGTFTAVIIAEVAD